MSYPMIMLGGLSIPAEAGLEQQDTERLVGRARVRMGNGAGVQMTHWGKAAGSISGSGLLPLGLDGLDYGNALELRLTKPRSIRQVGTSFTLNADCRPDREPWAFAMLDGRWRYTPCVRVDRAVTVTPVTGATEYLLCWMPMYSVWADEPTSSMSSMHGWSISFEEV